MAADLDALLGLTFDKQQEEETRDEREGVEAREKDGRDGDDERSEDREPGEHEESLEADRDEPARDAKADDDHPADDAAGKEPKEGEEGDGDDREKALLKEIARLRGQLAAKPPIAPDASQTTAQPVRPRRPPLVEVKVSEDGSRAYVDPAALQEQVRQLAHEEAIRMTTPSPEQMRAMQIERATQEYVAKNPIAQTAVNRANQADQFLTAHLMTFQQQGHRFNNFNEVVEVMRATGIEDQFFDYFPELKDVGLEDFVEAMSSGLPSARKLLYDRIASHSAPKRQPSKPKPNNNGAPRKLGDQPKSMTRKGGGRVTAATSDTAEFNDLEGRFRDNPFSFPDKEYKRLQVLAKRLGVEGY